MAGDRRTAVRVAHPRDRRWARLSAGTNLSLPSHRSRILQASRSPPEGPEGDTGVTGRKIIVDTYGGFGSHGGGCFSGKDPSKVDRSGSYMARYVAKNLVASGVCKKVEVSLSYAIGVAEPISITVNTFGTGSIDESKLVVILRKLFDFTPQGIIDKLQLRRPIYKRTACYGHFGREEEGFTWEICDMVDAIKREVR